MVQSPMATNTTKQIPPVPSKIVIVGEAWGEQEELQGRPFVGASGRLLTYLLRQAGIVREHCYITNTVNKRPPNNKYHLFSDEEIRKGVEELKRDLEEWKPNVVIALGNHALEKLTGLSGILSYRGYVFESTLVRGLKVVPTIHPAMLLRGQTGCNPVVVADLRKAKRESEFPEIRIPQRNIQIVKDPALAVALLESVTDIDSPVACDIETPKEAGRNWLRAYGIATSPKDAFVLTESVLKVPSVLRALGRFSRSSTKKIFHNANFDVFILAYYYKIVTKNVEDTMIAQHVCYPSLPSILKPKSLSFCASVYTDEPYWKGDMEQDLYIYNGKDCCVTYEVWNALQKELDSWGVREVYEKDMELMEPLLTMKMKGLRVDLDALERLKKRNEFVIERLEFVRDKTIGDVNVLSPKQMSELLYKRWKFPPVMKDGRVTTDVKALTKLESLSTPYQPLLGLIKKLRKHYKMRDFYNLSLAKNGRMMADFKIAGTISGRLASSELEGMGVGRNLQNIPKPFREVYVPDEGKVFVNADLSQAEARVVAALTGDEEWVREFDKGDVYKKTASFLFGVKEEDVTKEQRQLAKTVTHACNYGESWKGLSETLEIPAARAKYFMKKLYEFRPALQRWHDKVEGQVRNERVIRSAYGRVLQFFGKISDRDIRTALSFNPQGVVADYLNRGIIAVYNNVEEAELLCQVHDSLLFQVDNDPEVVRKVIKKVRELMVHEVCVNGIRLTIPAEFEIGYDWFNMYEVDDDSFDEVWRRINEESPDRKRDFLE